MAWFDVTVNAGGVQETYRLWDRTQGAVTWVAMAGLRLFIREGHVPSAEAGLTVTVEATGGGEE